MSDTDIYKECKGSLNKSGLSSSFLGSKTRSKSTANGKGGKGQEKN